jgi:hypothetical protein
MEEGKIQQGTISWIDLTVPNAEEVRDFYAGIAGWRAQPVDMQGYSDYMMMSPHTGAPVAGVCHARSINAGLPPYWLVYITVDNMEHSMKRCMELGGRILIQPKEMGKHGRYCVIQDPAGAVAALFQPPPTQEEPR